MPALNIVSIAEQPGRKKLIKNSSKKCIDFMMLLLGSSYEIQLTCPITLKSNDGVCQLYFGIILFKISYLIVQCFSVNIKTGSRFGFIKFYFF